MSDFLQIIVLVACNLINNLPAGLIAGNALQSGHKSEMVKSAVLIGMDRTESFDYRIARDDLMACYAPQGRTGRECLDIFKIGGVVMNAAQVIAILSMRI
jgi:arsenical pump membrane protein